MCTNRSNPCHSLFSTNDCNFNIEVNFYQLNFVYDWIYNPLSIVIHIIHLSFFLKYDESHKHTHWYSLHLNRALKKVKIKFFIFHSVASINIPIICIIIVFFIIISNILSWDNTINLYEEGNAWRAALSSLFPCYPPYIFLFIYSS